MKYQNTLRKISKLDKTTKSQIQEIFLKDEEIYVEVNSKDIGKSGFEILTPEGICFVTEYSIGYCNKKYGRITSTQEEILYLSIPIPLNIGQGTIIDDIHQINQSNDPKKKSDEWLINELTEEVATTYFLRYFSKSNSLKSYKTIIFEAIEAYYMGMEHIAIMSLLPVFEGGLRNLQYIFLGKDSQNISSTEFEKGLKDLVLKVGQRNTKEYIWYPGKDYSPDLEIDFFTHISPQSDVINAFRLFFDRVLYKDSRKTTTSLNRHVILHMLKNDFNNRANFPRIFYALTHITFVESLSNQEVPLFWPGYINDNEVIAWSIYLKKIALTFKEPRQKILDASGISNYYGAGQ